MNIGIVTAWYDCGAGYVSKAYEKALSSKHNIFIYARGKKTGKGDPFWDRGNVHWAKPHMAISGIHSNEFSSWAKLNHIEAVIFNEQRHWAPVLLSKKMGLLSGAYVDFYTHDMIPLFDLFDFLICNTRRHFSVFKQHTQTCFCPWGVDINKFSPSHVKQQLHAPPKLVTFLISSGWGGQKSHNNPALDRRGTAPLLRAFHNVDKECQLIVHSQVPLDRCPEEWKRIVNSDKRIRFVCENVKPPGLYNLADVYIYPSRLDGIGLTLPEALACGLPAITTNAAPMNEFVQEGVNGRLIRVAKEVKRYDGYYWPESICDESHLSKLILDYATNAGLVLAHGRAARNLAKEHLSWQSNSAFLPGWIENLQTTANNKRPSSLPLERLAREQDRTHQWTHLKLWLASRKSAKDYIRAILMRFKSRGGSPHEQ